MYNSAIAVMKGIRTEFAKQMATPADSVFKPIYFDGKSSSDKEDYMFFDSFPGIKEWIDKIGFKPVKDYVYAIRNKHWYGDAILVNRDTLDDSKKELGGGIELQIKANADNWKRFVDRLINDLLVANGNAFDGAAFFANARNIESAAAIDNLNSGTGTTLAQFTADLAAARLSLWGFKDANGNPINYNPKFVAIIPPSLEDVALTLRNSQQIYNGTATVTNIYQNTFDIVINSWEAANDWYLANVNASIPPFIVQRRADVKFNIKDEPDDLYIRYFSDSRLNAGYGNPTAIVKVDNS